MTHRKKGIKMSFSTTAVRSVAVPGLLLLLALAAALSLTIGAKSDMIMIVIIVIDFIQLW
jgi:hypothetical protein